MSAQLEVSLQVEEGEEI